MKVFICADMEGATGIVHRDQLMPEGGAPYVAGCRLLTGDVVAACTGAIRAGAREIVISEGHANMRHILLEDLPAQARLVRGPALWPQKPLCQIAGLDESFDLAFFIGFHSRAGTVGGLLSHTWAGAIVHELRLNGQVLGETAINAILCGSFGVPVGLVAGADDLVAEAQADLARFGPVDFVTTKKALGFNLAECWGPKATGPWLEQAAFDAAQRWMSEGLRPWVIAGPVRAELDCHRREMVDRMLLATPGLLRNGDRGVAVEAESARSALSTLWRAITEAFHEPSAWLR